MVTRRTALGWALLAFGLGALLAPTLPLGWAQGEIRAPNWKYGLSTRVRKGQEADFTAETRKFGIEVYRDENNGNLIYISETGSIAVVPNK
jgi:hypothetical protein